MRESFHASVEYNSRLVVAVVDQERNLEQGSGHYDIVNQR